jgi:hypothetical protein
MNPEAPLSAILEKVRKLRALATSSNEHEAAAAAAAAERIIQEHRLSEAEVEAGGEAPTEKASDGHEPITTHAKRAPYWRKYLVSGLSSRHGCATYLRYAGGGGWAHQIVGRKSDVETVRYLFAWLSLEIDRLAGLHKGEGRAWLNSYRVGAVAGCLEAMAVAEREIRAQAHVTSTAIVRVDARREEAKAALPGGLGKGSGYNGSINSGGGYAAGKRDGANIHTGVRIGGGAARALPAKGD